MLRGLKKAQKDLKSLKKAQDAPKKLKTSQSVTFHDSDCGVGIFCQILSAFVERPLLMNLFCMIQFDTKKFHFCHGEIIIFPSTVTTAAQP